MLNTFKTYYQLIKPGMIRGNIITATAGFLLASRGNIHFPLLLATLIGISLIIASACVINNYIDRDIDKLMERTKKRAFPQESVSTNHAVIFATILGISGIIVLGLYTNTLTLTLGAIGFIDYVVFYSIWKRRSHWGTIVGSISGAMPLVSGYTAVTNRFDIGALLLFLIMVLWQMPHFYSIAIYRFNDYKAASIPVLPVSHGLLATKINIVIYILAFLLAVMLLTFFGITGYIYLITMTIMGLLWLGLGISGFFTKNSTKWARQMFFVSLITLFFLSVLISTSGTLHLQ